MNKERNCQKCIHHISGLCSKWDCEMQTLEEYRDKVVDEFAERIKELYPVKGNINITINRMIDLVVKQMKAGDK